MLRLMRPTIPTDYIYAVRLTQKTIVIALLSVAVGITIARERTYKNRITFHNWLQYFQTFRHRSLMNGLIRPNCKSNLLQICFARGRPSVIFGIADSITECENKDSNYGADND